MRAIILATILSATPALADLPTGTKTITLKSESEAVTIGAVEFLGDADTRTIRVTLTESLFKDHFLSMRPFKCLEGAKFYCHLPYPYEWKGEIRADDLTDLEYALLFVQKDPAAYGINLWNGIYYKLELAPDGRIAGTLHEVDMDALASPPQRGNLRPLADEDLTKADPKGQWLPSLVID